MLPSSKQPPKSATSQEWHCSDHYHEVMPFRFYPCIGSIDHSVNRAYTRMNRAIFVLRLASSNWKIWRSVWRSTWNYSQTTLACLFKIEYASIAKNYESPSQCHVMLSSLSHSNNSFVSLLPISARILWCLKIIHCLPVICSFSSSEWCMIISLSMLLGWDRSKWKRAAGIRSEPLALLESLCKAPVTKRSVPAPDQSISACAQQVPGDGLWVAFTCAYYRSISCFISCALQ